jgi:hypothetical protein
MATPSASNLQERWSPGARALLGFLRTSSGTGMAARVRELPPKAWDETLELALYHGA